MSLTNTQKINIGSLSEAYATVDIEKLGLNARGIDVNIAKKIYLLRKSISWAYNFNQTNSTLTATSNYLIALCGKYFLKAQANIIGGGTISPVTPITVGFEYLI